MTDRKVRLTVLGLRDGAVSLALPVQSPGGVLVCRFDYGLQTHAGLSCV
jgi:hypothetical protein